jgi:hypothetical protein
MAAPSFSFYQAGSTPSSGTPITLASQINFGLVEKGVISAVITIDIWNDRGGLAGSDIAVAPKLHALSVPDSISVIFAGTVSNGNLSMLEARSCGALNTSADQHQVWTPISLTSFLTMGDMPSNSKRSIELRLNVPYDAADLTPLKTFSLRVQA